MDTEAAIAVLTAMITPAVLISACGSMILSTSSRLGRVVDRVPIGVVPFTGNQRYSMIPVVLGLAGACFLFYGSILLILEARLALSTIHAEMDFIWRQSKRATPPEIVEQHKPHFVHFRRHD